MMSIGQKVKVKITCLVSYGAFCEVMDGNQLRKGLIHISEFSDYFVTSVNQYVATGDEVEVQLIGIIEETQQLRLSYKNLRPELLKSDLVKAREARRLSRFKKF
ncbi:hypothetical protein SCLARK_00618 [Spiroplasma clarkii]|uniref:S1 motif domain-containing protein n=1 Tax=Spiroplasma clarkii TaxID=2139 RepID=A0A1Y0KZW7_9MOLU|nr:S1 RNA-binding domain-containing protein [Spiroplasma clarkii]ARU91287.1 hypothetical protein SCLARK_00618 [Spiroplasma clarkii]ATX70722.1 hypothetical protein SCLAR_v1c03920 [Spiroplasma clarkii]